MNYRTERVYPDVCRIVLECWGVELPIAEHADRRLALIEARWKLWELIGQMDYEMARADE